MVLEIMSTASSYHNGFLVMNNVLNLILKFEHGTAVADFSVTMQLALCRLNFGQVSQCDKTLGRRS
jgi:hypothetical protein